jgi:methyl-accepting chemotaxis protein
MKNLKVSLKLLTGFGISVLFILIVGIIGVRGMNTLNTEYGAIIDNHAKPLGNGADILAAVHSLRAELRLCVLNTGKQDKVRETEALINNWYKKYEENMEEFGKSISEPEDKALLIEADESYAKFKTVMLEVIDRAKNGEDQSELMKFMLSNALPNANKTAECVTKVVENKKVWLQNADNQGEAIASELFTTTLIIIIVSAVIAVFLGIYISSLISKPLGSAVNMINEMSLGHLDTRLRLDRKDEIGVMAKTMDAFAEDLKNIVIGTMKKISVGDLSTEIELRDDRDEIADALKRTLESLRALIIDDGGRVLTAAAGKDLSQRLTGNYNGEYAKMKDHINTVVGNLDDALNQVTEAVSQVTSASNQIASGAQSLAEGSNEQASSLEEVSSSLEEMSSMTKQTAENSNKATVLVSEARAAAGEGDESMKRMAEAISQIKASSDNTAKIIKTIDDLAFQTNLLALNAAVEAARAGEAGKGFAVVAEEVRNLAIRSADAAKNTESLIEASVKNADSGVIITKEVAKSLDDIVDRTEKMGELIGEIAAASNEQAQGIEQVNKALAQMNQVTQSNAANSEESASAAEELSSQADELSTMVSEFTLSDGGGNGQNGQSGLPGPRKFAAIADKKTAGKTKVAGGWVSANFARPAKSVRAEEIIPLDDEELSEF